MKRVVLFLVSIIMVMPAVISAQATFNLETGTGTGTGWTWNDPVLTINNGANITITGQVNQSDNHKRIVIAPNATTHVTLNNVAITTGQYVTGDFEHPIYLSDGVTLTLTVVGENVIKAGDYVPGISVSTGRTLTIDGTGSLSVTGGWSCAGIGGGLWDYGPCGNITINSGTIYAKGAASSWYGTAGAGIGSGASYANGSLTINGGVVTALPGNDAGMGIGNGGGDSFGTLKITGNSIVFTNIAGDMNPDNKTGGILVVGNATHWYGGDNFTLNHNVTVPNTNLLTIELGKTITIPAGMTLTNNGTIVNYSNITIAGTFVNNGVIVNVNSGTINGTVSGNPPTTTAPLGSNINLNDNNTPQIGEKWVFANNIFTVLDGADVNITGSGTGQKRIEVAANSLSNITLNNVSFTAMSGDKTPFLINNGAKVNLTIEGDNILEAGRSRAGLQAAKGATLTIDGTGSLKATGGKYGGAGIGGAFRENCGKITINGGTITASNFDSYESYHAGAAIGGGGAGIVFFSFDGMGGEGGDITINGGTITAVGRFGAAGIGGGCSSGNGGTLSMNGNAVVFTSLTASGMIHGDIKTNINGVLRGILFDEYEGLCYGPVICVDEVELPQDYTLTVPADASFTVPENSVFIFNGKINNNGTIRDDGGIFVLNGILNGNKIVFNNIGNETDSLSFTMTPIDIAYLFRINQNTGIPIYSVEENSTGEGTIECNFLTVIKGGTFIIGLVTEETYYYAVGEKVTSTLFVQPEVSITELTNPSLTAWINNDMLFVNGLTEGKMWSVYDISGKLVYRAIATGNMESVLLSSNGLFIIHSEGSTMKVIKN